MRSDVEFGSIQPNSTLEGYPKHDLRQAHEAGLHTALATRGAAKRRDGATNFRGVRDAQHLEPDLAADGATNAHPLGGHEVPIVAVRCSAVWIGPRPRTQQRIAKRLTRQTVQYRVLRASRRAKLSQDGVRVLRHTFCSHLAMRGAPPRAIQELAGHRELGMTQRYMHLSPAALDSAIRLLDQPSGVQSFGDILETRRVSEGKING